LLINDAWRLPTGDGSAGQALLSDGAGQSYWGSAGGTPALTDTYIGYGSGSNLLTGSAGFTKVNNTVSLGDISSDGKFVAVSTSGSNTTYKAGNIIHTGGSAPADREFQIQGADGSGTNKAGGDIVIVTGRQTGNAASPHMHFRNTRTTAASSSSVNTLETFLSNDDAVTILGYASGVGNGTNITVDDLNELVTVNNSIIRGDAFHNNATAQGSATQQDIRSVNGPVWA
jgi:hypothetical protein